MTILPEHAIIKLFILYPDIYNKYNIYINTYIKDIYPDIYKLYLMLNAFRIKYPESSSLEDYHVFVVESSRPEQREREKVEAILRLIEDSNASPEAIDGLLRQMARRHLLLKLASTSFEAADRPEKEQELAVLYESFVSLKKDSVLLEEEYNFVTDDLEELYNVQVKTPGLRWRLESLNQSLGSLRLGDFGFVFARPETGKTTFLASETSYMASKAVRPVLWFNNEEQGEKVKIRIYQAVLGYPLEVLLQNRKKAMKEFMEETHGNIKLVDEAIISRAFVEKMCDRVKPSLIIFDQIDKITGFDEDREDLKLGAIYQWARELAKTYSPVIGICQADGSGEGIKWLTMSNVANAKTAKQSEADWILGIGRTNEIGMEQVRHFHLSKNKLIGDTDTKPDRRHDRWDVLIEPEIARYRDIIKYGI